MARKDLILLRRDTAFNLATVNPVLASGEPCYNSTNGYLTIGDGTSRYNQLPPFARSNAILDVVGIEWNTASTSPTLKHIDINGNQRIGLNSTYFNSHPVWGGMLRCTINPATGEPVYGTNARGDGLDLTGASGNVMVRVPRFYVKSSSDGTIHKWWISVYPLEGFELHPAFLQRGGTEVKNLFVSAYEAAGFLDGATFKLKSATGLQPVTGAVSYPNLPNSGRLYIGDAEQYANNIGTGYGITNVWTLAALRLLFYTEYASLDSQVALGRGVVDLASGTNFAGLNTGALSADTNIGTNGTGTGTGTAGQRPIVYRGIENVWGNVWKWVIGLNFYDTVHRIIKADGTGTLAAILAAGNYTESASAPPNTSTATSGYGSNVFMDSVLKNLLITSVVSASGSGSSTYLCDYYSLRAANATPTCLLFGGAWNDGSNAGAGNLNSNNGSTTSGRSLGARLEFLKR